jgi:hypothetical protein
VTSTRQSGNNCRLTRATASDKCDSVSIDYRRARMESSKSAEAEDKAKNRTEEVGQRIFQRYLGRPTTSYVFPVTGYVKRGSVTVNKTVQSRAGKIVNPDAWFVLFRLENQNALFCCSCYFLPTVTAQSNIDWSRIFLR